MSVQEWNKIVLRKTASLKQSSTTTIHHYCPDNLSYNLSDKSIDMPILLTIPHRNTIQALRQTLLDLKGYHQALDIAIDIITLPCFSYNTTVSQHRI